MYRMRKSKRKQCCLDALAEMQAMIQERYPEATFYVAEGDDPPGSYLHPVVDVEDVVDVIDVVRDQLYDYQVEQRLPIYIFPRRPANSKIPIG